MTDDAEIHAFLDEHETTLIEEAEWTHTHQIEFVRLATPQRDWVSLQASRAVWRGANSLGKSLAQAYDIVHVVRGTHPFRPVRQPPVTVLVVSYSWAQMDPLLEKLWDLLPKDEIDPAVYYVPAQGIKGYKEPVIPIVAGPGAGSRIVFATYKQGAGRIMGNQVDVVYLDEPPPYDVWGEVQPRLNAKKGQLRVSFTPTPESPDLEYLRDEVRKGHESNGRRGVVELQTSITLDAVTPRGSAIVDVPRMSQEEIEAQLDTYLEDERDMREHGAWFPLAKGRWVSTFTDDNVNAYTRPPAGAFLVVSLDHGAQAGKQAAMLSAYTDRDDPRLVRAWWMAETIGTGATTTEEDARAILDMLESEGIPYDAIDLWTGDRALESVTRLVAKSNEKLRRAMADILGRPYGETKPIHVPMKFSGSVRLGAKLLRDLFKRRVVEGGPPAGVVAPRCTRFREACLKFAGNKQAPEKDIFDAGRYGAEAAITGRQQIDVRFRM